MSKAVIGVKYSMVNVGKIWLGFRGDKPLPLSGTSRVNDTNKLKIALV